MCTLDISSTTGLVYCPTGTTTIGNPACYACIHTILGIVTPETSKEEAVTSSLGYSHLGEGQLTCPSVSRLRDAALDKTTMEISPETKGKITYNGRDPSSSYMTEKL